MTATLGARVRDFASLVKLSHSVFALPFAMLALLVATRGRPPLRLLLLCIGAVVAARTAAMAWNRYADRDIDAANPRTRGRELPRGAVSPRAALVLCAVAAAAFVLCCALLGPTCAWGSVPVLLWLLGYSQLKRFSALCHLWLGAALGLAPVACHVAAFDAGLAPAVPWQAPVVLGLGVMAWVAGFDVLYACQDEGFDRAHGLRSIPARFGARGALRISRLLHAAAVLLFAAFLPLAGLSWGYATGVLAAAGLLGWQHRALEPGRLQALQPGFFLVNGVLSVAMLACGAIDVYFLQS
ncbi:MAG: UbiA-like polyprenyltransferase [Planctomycetota bacterium]